VIDTTFKPLLFRTPRRCDSLNDAKCSLNDAKCSLNDAKCSLNDAKCSLNDAKRSLNDAKCSLLVIDTYIEKACLVAVA
jgi:hypothetical protein